MLDTNDVQVLRDMFAENNQLIFKKIDEKVDGLRKEIFTKIETEVRSVRDDVIEVINDGILPQIERLNVRITRLERMQRQTAY